MTPDAATVDGERIDLTAEQYDRVRQAAATYREAVVVRLCGEVGLRPPEIARVTPGDFSRRTTRNGTHHFVAVADGDGGATREAYVPASVRSAVRRYVNDNGIGEDEPVVAVTPRRIQMVVGEVTDRAAEEHGDDRLARVSSGDLCRYYARRLVHREGVDARVVQAVGPWESFDTLVRHLDPVDVDTVVAEFERTDVAGPTRTDRTAEIGAAVAAAEFGVLVVGPEGRVAFANDGFAALTGAEGDLAGRDVAELYVGEEPAPPAETSGPVPVRLRGADGEPVGAVRVATPRSTPDGSDGGYVAAFLAADDEADAGPAAQAPARITDAVGVLDAVTEELSAASNRREVASRVSERLATSDAYAFAWVGSETGDRGVVSTAWEGIDEATAERLAEAATDATGGSDDPAASLGDVRVHAADGDGATPALLGGDGTGRSPPAAAVAFVPIVYGDTTHGLLAVGTDAEDAFGADERRVLSSLGWQVGQAMTDIERRNLLLADSVTELEFRVESEAAFFVRVSRDLGASFELQGLVPGEGQTLLYFVRMRETTPEEVFAFADGADSIESARLIRDYGDTYLVEFVVGGEEPATTLTDLGGYVTDFTVADGAQRITAEFTTETNVRAVFNGFQTPFPDSDLFSKRKAERPVQTTDGFRRSLEDDLTDKQQSVLRAAYLAGYFEWPRGSTAEELADSIGVSSPTLHNHLRKAQQKVLTAFFDESE